MSQKQFQTELRKNLPSPLYMLHSTENFLLYEALSLIKEQLHGGDVFNFEVFDVESSDTRVSIEDMLNSLNTLPLMSQRRTVIIRNIQKLAKKDIKKLEVYLDNPSGTSLLVMLIEGRAPKLFDDRSVKNLVAISLNIRELDMPWWVKEKGKNKGLTFTAGAVEYLINSVGIDPGLLHAEIEKFSSWGKNIIDIPDVKAMVYAGIEYTGFDLFDALMKRDASEVFRIFEHVSRTLAPQMLLGALNWKYEIMSRKSFEDGKDEQHQGSYEIFRLLHEADASIKRSRSYVMEDLLIKLLHLNGRSSKNL
ncbi:MAG: DNA polymerase III subunit delta [Dissulfurispiraceae bacterium]